MDAANGLKEATQVTAAVASNTLSVNVFTAPGKTMVGERPRPFGEPLGFDPITSTLIFGEYDAVLVDAMMILLDRFPGARAIATPKTLDAMQMSFIPVTVAEAKALADWVALHNRNLETIYIPHGHFDQFYGLSMGHPSLLGSIGRVEPKQCANGYAANSSPKQR
jgi:glyoxylase-like metal-dependent hydrolase (beta-lactamase superfamily II)